MVGGPDEGFMKVKELFDIMGKKPFIVENLETVNLLKFVII